MLNDKMMRDINAYIDTFFAREAGTEYFVMQSCYCSDADDFPAMGLSNGADWEELLKHTDAGFSETLLKLIDNSGKTDAEVYKRVNVDRKLFSKIRNNPNYKPSKNTAIALAMALELDLAAANDLIGRAGYKFTHSSVFDLIIEYFIVHQNYDFYELNQVLLRFDQPTVGV